MTAMAEKPEAGDTHFFWLYLLIQPYFSRLSNMKFFLYFIEPVIQRYSGHSMPSIYGEEKTSTCDTDEMERLGARDQTRS
jgi:hypothetical protein